jgi:hypothetical protein
MLQIVTLFRFLSNRFRKSFICLKLQSQSDGGYFCGFCLLCVQCAVAFCNSFSGFWTAYYRVEKINRNMIRNWLESTIGNDFVMRQGSMGEASSWSL